MHRASRRRIPNRRCCASCRPNYPRTYGRLGRKSARMMGPIFFWCFFFQLGLLLLPLLLMVLQEALLYCRLVLGAILVLVVLIARCVRRLCDGRWQRTIEVYHPSPILPREGFHSPVALLLLFAFACCKASDQFLEYGACFGDELSVYPSLVRQIEILYKSNAVGS
jgi:uncharacterized membrane protein YhaH (DUF805 family)